jgi:hypothetical protein
MIDYLWIYYKQWNTQVRQIKNGIRDNKRESLLTKFSINNNVLIWVYSSLPNAEHFKLNKWGILKGKNIIIFKI